MQNSKIIIGGIVAGITFFILGFIFYGLLLKNFLASQSMPGAYKEIPSFPMLILGQLLYGFVFALVIGTWGKASSAGDGAKKGFALALLMGAAYDITYYATSNIMTLQGMLVDIAVVVVMGVIAGAVVGAVMSPKKA
jgi:hypothetical protein